MTQPRHHQNQRSAPPRHVFATAGHDALEELIKPEPPYNFQSQPRSAELAFVLDAHSRRVDFHPVRFDDRLIGIGRLIEQRELPRAARRLRLVPAGRARIACRAFHAESSGFIKPAQPCHHPLPWPGVGAIRFDQRPSGVSFPILVSKTLPDKHGGGCYR